MSWKAENDEDEAPVMIPWKARSEITPEDHSLNEGDKDSNLQKGFWATARRIYSAIRGHTAEDVGRLREAGVQRVEGPSKLKLAETEATLAQAAKAHAEAEKARAEAAKIRAEAQSTMIATEASVIATRAEAFERVVAAISRIKQEGGDVAFDQDELRKLLEMRERSQDLENK